MFIQEPLGFSPREFQIRVHSAMPGL
jgi:hypothetical protein